MEHMDHIINSTNKYVKPEARLFHNELTPLELPYFSEVNLNNYFIIRNNILYYWIRNYPVNLLYFKMNKNFNLYLFRP